MAKDIEKLFSGDDNDVIMAKMSNLTEQTLVKQELVKNLEGQVKMEKELLGTMKAQLAEMMQANNCKNGHKFDNGIFPRPFTQTKIYKAKGVTDEQLHEWLKDNDLGDIIRPTVPWQTMNATLKKEIEAGKRLPDIFNITTEQSIKFSGNGHIKYLERVGKDGK